MPGTILSQPTPTRRTIYYPRSRTQHPGNSIAIQSKQIQPPWPPTSSEPSHVHRPPWSAQPNHAHEVHPPRPTPSIPTNTPHSPSTLLPPHLRIQRNPQPILQRLPAPRLQRRRPTSQPVSRYRQQEGPRHRVSGKPCEPPRGDWAGTAGRADAEPGRDEAGSE
jgi:hypothetical protein